MTTEELSERLIAFAARIGKVVDALPDTRMGRHVAGQLVRCGTSPAPNYEEARAAESRADFIHKLGVCLKELRESQCWIRLIVRAELLPEHKMGELHEECTGVVQHYRPIDCYGKEESRQQDALAFLSSICNFHFSILNFQFSAFRYVNQREMIEN